MMSACHHQVVTDTINPTPSDSSAVSVDSISPKASIVFQDGVVHDFGVYGERLPKSYDFIFRNVGDVPFVINHVDPSCGCLQVEYPKHAVPSGAVDTIHVTYDGNGFKSGFFIKTCDVYSNADSVFWLRVQGTYSKTLEEQWLKDHQQ